MLRFAYAVLGRYIQLRSSNANVLTAAWVRRSFVVAGVAPQSLQPPIPSRLLLQAAQMFAGEGYVEVRFSQIRRRSALCYGESSLNGMLSGITPSSMTFHPQDSRSHAVMMGDTLVLRGVAVTITGFRRHDGWEMIIETTLPCVTIEPDGRVITDG